MKFVPFALLLLFIFGIPYYLGFNLITEVYYFILGLLGSLILKSLKMNRNFFMFICLTLYVGIPSSEYFTHYKEELAAFLAFFLLLFFNFYNQICSKR